MTPEYPHDAMKRTNLGRTRAFVALTLLILAAGGCVSRPTSQASPGELLILGQQDLRSDRFDAARRAFKRLLREYPDSKHRRDALLNLADSYYKGEEYIEAKVQFSEYVQLYPISPNTSKAYYFLGMSDFNRVLSYDRDQSIARESLTSFKELVKRFPRSKFAPKGRAKIREVRDLIAKGDLFIAKFFLRRGQQVSAIPRFKEIVKEFRDVPEVRAEAYYLLGESLRLEESYKKAGKAYRALILQHPSSSFSRDAYDRLVSLTGN